MENEQQPPRIDTVDALIEDIQAEQESSTENQKPAACEFMRLGELGCIDFFVYKSAPKKSYGKQVRGH